MKKILSILGIITLTITTSTNIVGCYNNKIFQIDCSEIFGTKGEIRSLISDKNNQTWNEASVFSNFGKILSFKFNSFGIIYFINEKNEIYKFFEEVNKILNL